MGTEDRVNRVRYLSPKKQAAFPNLRSDNYCVTSLENDDYNCTAFVIGRTDTRLWPIEGDCEGVYWPKGILTEETIAAFIAAYATEGYTECSTSEPEPGFEKIALFVNESGKVTHAARQLMPSGEWASKLGGWEDINHATLADLEGPFPAYGKATNFLRRAIRESFAVSYLPPI